MIKHASAVLALILGLCVGVTAKAEDELTAGFSAAHAIAVKPRPFVRSDFALAAPLQAASSFVPAECAVESWCRVSATECFLGFTSNPGGLWQGHAQYSVVMRAVARCPVNYGHWETRTFMSGVEPQRFSSAVEVDRETASTGALQLCKAYRTDWMAAAPACDGR